MGMSKVFGPQGVTVNLRRKMAKKLMNLRQKNKMKIGEP